MQGKFRLLESSGLKHTHYMIEAMINGYSDMFLVILWLTAHFGNIQEQESVATVSSLWFQWARHPKLSNCDFLRARNSMKFIENTFFHMHSPFLFGCCPFQQTFPYRHITCQNVEQYHMLCLIAPDEVVFCCEPFLMQDICHSFHG